MLHNLKKCKFYKKKKLIIKKQIFVYRYDLFVLGELNKKQKHFNFKPTYSFLNVWISQIICLLTFDITKQA